MPVIVPQPGNTPSVLWHTGLPIWPPKRTEIVAGIRVHYSGLFQFGVPDIVVVNVTKDAVWTRKAAIPEAGNMSRPSPRDAIAFST